MKLGSGDAVKRFKEDMDPVRAQAVMQIIMDGSTYQVAAWVKKSKKCYNRDDAATLIVMYGGFQRIPAAGDFSETHDENEGFARS